MTKASHDAEAAAAVASLEPIRETIRRICIQDQFTWEQSWKSVLSDVNQAHRGLLLPAVFQQTLELNEIRLTSKALAAVVAQFAQPSGAVRAHAFLHWVDLSRPRDFVDPELVFARLPQPYRRIAKVLERDIVDAAWATIQATSARFKAESVAALSARSARSSVLLLHAGDDAADGGAALQDDYAAAKKRCCAAFAEIAAPVDPADVVAMRSHWKLPFAVVGWSHIMQNGGTGLILQLVETRRHVPLGSAQVEAPDVALTPGVADGAAIVTGLELVGVSELQVRASDGAADAAAMATLVIAIHVRVVPPPATGDTTDPVPPDGAAHVMVYELTAAASSSSSPSSVFTSRLLASLPFAGSLETVTALDLSRNAASLALATSKGETFVYAIAAPSPQQDDAAEPLPPSSVPLTLLAKLATEPPPSAVFFLNAPVVDAPARSPAVVTAPYALAIVADCVLFKFVLPTTPPPADSTSVASTTANSTLWAAWPHLVPITAASIDVTTQFVTLGLADGMVVVWDLLEDRDHVMLTPPPPPSSAVTPSAASIDAALLSSDHFVVALSLATQQLVFYDITNRAAPTLLRVVTPPPPTSSSAEAAEPIRFCSLALHSAFLDVPVVIVEYSNGYAMLYDVRNGEALGSVRIAKQSSRRLLPLHRTSPASAVVLAVAPSLRVFDWADLFKTSFPALAKVVEDKRLEVTTPNVKRVFIDSVDTTPPMTLSVGAKASLHSLLIASAGHSHHRTAAASSLVTPLEPLTGSKSSSSLSQASNTDSRASLATTASGGSSSVASTSQPTSQQAGDPATPLPELATYPYKPTIAALYERLCEQEHGFAQRGDRDAKLQRRRNELLKILTATW